MPWVQIFAVLCVSHLAGDFVLQTEWQAANKHGGFGGSLESRRALAAHIATYTAAYLPAFVWLAGDLGLGVVLAAVLIALPHAIQDDARLLEAYALRVKRIRPRDHPVVLLLLDQSMHIIALLLTAIILSG